MEADLPYLFINEDQLKDLPRRDAGGHKGSFGKVLCICGSPNMPGASILNARAVMRSGAGMVKVLTSSCNRELLVLSIPEAMFANGDEMDAASFRETLSWADSLLMGCGLTVAGALHYLQGEWGEILQNFPGTIVFDADALNALAKDPTVLEKRAEKGLPQILTPHEMEYHRLRDGIPAGAVEDMAAWAKAAGCVLVRKGADTRIVNGLYQKVDTKEQTSQMHGLYQEAGNSKVICYQGQNDGMATAGSGDVLSGIIAAMACVCATPLEAAVSGVLLHGAAGRKAVEKLGRHSMLAGDIIGALPEVFRQIEIMQNEGE